MSGRTVWHEALPGDLGGKATVCHHQVARETPLYLIVESSCDPEGSEGTVQVRRDELATGVGVDALVARRAGGSLRRYVAYFFEGPVPETPIRPPGWLRERRRAERNAGGRAQAAAPPPVPDPGAAPPKVRTRKPTLRDAVRAAVETMLAKLAPWSRGFRLKTAKPRTRRDQHAAYIIARRADGTERIVVEVKGRTEKDALEALRVAVLLATTLGRPIPESGATRGSASSDDLAALGLAELPVDAAGLAKAWQAAVQRTHPDKPGGSDEAFKRVTAAHERLKKIMA